MTAGREHWQVKGEASALRLQVPGDGASGLLGGLATVLKQLPAMPGCRVTASALSNTH